MQVVTGADRRALEPQVREAFQDRWPEFVFHGQAGPRYLPRIAEYFGDLDMLLLDDGKVAAGGWGVTFAWDGTVADLPAGYDGALARSVHDHESQRPATALSFMAAAVAADYDGRGLAGRVLREISTLAGRLGVEHVVAPLRPTLKHRYPTHSMAEYAAWSRPDGLSIDPWIRTHQRMGAKILGTAHRSMVITGTVAEWESWTAMVFPVSGRYIIPDGLNPLSVDRETDLARYEEENLWVQHR